jgi:hypothetical protein
MVSVMVRRTKVRGARLVESHSWFKCCGQEENLYPCPTKHDYPVFSSCNLTLARIMQRPNILASQCSVKIGVKSGESLSAVLSRKCI